MNQVEELSKAAAPRKDSVELAVSQEPKSLAQALHTALSQAVATKPRVQASLDLTQDLFSLVYVKARGPVSRLSEAAKRLPNLKKQEVERLLDYFELVVVDAKQDWEVWRKQVVRSALLAQRSAQTFEGILWKIIG